MGLDMYLEAERYISGWGHGPDPEYSQLKKILGVSPTEHSPSFSVSYNVAYWRKANAIHNWFVQNVQGGKDECQRSYVERSQLIKLRDLCQDVIDHCEVIDGQVHSGTQYNAEHPNGIKLMEDGKVIKDASYAEAHLPAQSGFFFGGTEYDEYYLDNLYSTVEQLDEALKLGDDFEFYYRASW